MEDYAYVLDVLPEGRPDSKRRFRREPLVYGLGIEEFKIFLGVPFGFFLSNLIFNFKFIFFIKKFANWRIVFSSPLPTFIKVSFVFLSN